MAKAVDTILTWIEQADSVRQIIEPTQCSEQKTEWVPMEVQDINIPKWINVMIATGEPGGTYRIWGQKDESGVQCDITQVTPIRHEQWESRKAKMQRRIQKLSGTQCRQATAFAIQDLTSNRAHLVKQASRQLMERKGIQF